MRTLLLWLAACGGTSNSADTSGTSASDPTDTAGGGPSASCAYPNGAVEPMAVGEVLSPYRWPDARSRRDGRQVALDLGHVPCNTDPDIDWSPFDVLLFVSIPAW